MADNLAYFPYQQQDEPLFIIHQIDIIVSVSGSNLIQSFREVANQSTIFIYSFILNIYIAPLQENYSEALPTPARLKRAVSSWEKNAGDKALGKIQSWEGRPFQIPVCLSFYLSVSFCLSGSLFFTICLWLSLSLSLSLPLSLFVSLTLWLCLSWERWTDLLVSEDG